MIGAKSTASADLTADSDAFIAAGGGLKLLGYSIRETAGTPAVATARIMHGATVASGTKMVGIELAADRSETKWFGPEGIECPAGISIDHIAGTFEIVVYTRQD